MLDSEVLPWRTITFFGGQGETVAEADVLPPLLALDFVFFEEVLPLAALSQFVEDFFLALIGFLGAFAGECDFGVLADCGFSVVPCGEFCVGVLPEFCGGCTGRCSGAGCA
jgi:hypothetical protein